MKPKTTIQIILVIVLSLLLFTPRLVKAQCPPEGLGDAKHQAANLLKNRTTIPVDSPVFYNVADLLNVLDGDTLYPDSLYVAVTGYLVHAKAGGQEDCECHSTNPTDFDYHLELAAHPGDEGKQSMICEITRYTKSLVNMTLPQIRKLVGQQITVVGYFFHDAEHTNASVADSPQNAHDWRATTLEVHPVTQLIH